MCEHKFEHWCGIVCVHAHACLHVFLYVQMSMYVCEELIIVSAYICKITNRYEYFFFSSFFVQFNNVGQSQISSVNPTAFLNLAEYLTHALVVFKYLTKNCMSMI